MNELWKKYKKNIVITIIVIFLCAGCFCAGRFIRIRGASEDGIRAEQRIEQLERETGVLGNALAERVRECEQLEQQLRDVEDTVRGASEIVEQSGNTIGQLGETVGGLESTSSKFGDIIKQLREGQRAIKKYVEQLEQDNNRLKDELGKLQESIGEQ